jgi:hypothetical protein
MLRRLVWYRLTDKIALNAKGHKSYSPVSYNTDEVNHPGPVTMHKIFGMKLVEVRTLENSVHSLDGAVFGFWRCKKQLFVDGLTLPRLPG